MIRDACMDLSVFCFCVAIWKEALEIGRQVCCVLDVFQWCTEGVKGVSLWKELGEHQVGFNH